jgi:hypothetical protein
VNSEIECKTRSSTNINNLLVFVSIQSIILCWEIVARLLVNVTRNGTSETNGVVLYIQDKG